MRRSVKYAIILAIFLAIFLCLPFFFGLFVQRNITRFLQNENKTLGKVFGVQLVISQYDRGWFASHAMLEIEKKKSDGDYSVLKTVPVMIEHGPAYHYKDGFDLGLGLITIPDVKINEFPYQIHFQEKINFTHMHGKFSLIANKTAAPILGALNVDQLVLHMNSNLKADDFVFQLMAKGLQFQTPQQNVSINIKNIQSVLAAHFLDKQHWQMVLSANFGDDQLSAVLPDDASTAVTLNATQLNLDDLHFDTQALAKLLSEVVALRQATAAQQPISSTEWVALVQQFLTEMIGSDTSFQATGLSVGTPMGQFKVNYSAGFPTLPIHHDYFDVATRNVGMLALSVPNWQYTDTQSSAIYTLANLTYNEKNNTVFSRHSDLTMGSLSVAAPAAMTPTMKVDGLTYSGDLFGDVTNLSQEMHWKISDVCFSKDCFSDMHGKLELLKMNFDAFRNIAAATQKVVQYNPNNTTKTLADRWTKLTSAYLKLITPNTQIVVSHDMMTKNGELKIKGSLSWPNITKTTLSTMNINSCLQQASYEVHALLPAAYVDDFLSQTSFNQSPIAATTNTPSTQSQFEQQAQQFVQYALTQGYLKKVSNSYILDLVGKNNVITINGVPWKAPS